MLSVTQSPTTSIPPLAPAQCSIPQGVAAHEMKPELLRSAASAAADIGLLLPVPLFLLIAYLKKN